jgi:flavodoxin
MKVCVLYASQSKGNEKMKAIAKALAEGIGSQGHMVDVLDMTLEGGKIVSYYDYLLIGTESANFFGGKIPTSVSLFL